MREVGITSFDQVFGGLGGENNPFAGGGSNPNGGSNSFTSSGTSFNGVYTWDFTGLEESNFTDSNNPYNKLLTLLGSSNPVASDDNSAEADDCVGEDSAEGGANTSGNNDQTGTLAQQAHESNLIFTENTLAEFLSILASKNPSASHDSSSANGNPTVNNLPLPFDDPNWFTNLSNTIQAQGDKFTATSNEAIGNGNWYFGSDNGTFGNGNWYFSDNNVTVGNGNWHYGTHNATVGNGNWNFGDGNATIGNGNWYSGNNNQILGNGNWVAGNNNIVIGSPISNGKIFTGNDSLIIGNKDEALVIDRHAISDELSHELDELLNGGLTQLQNPNNANVLTGDFINSFYNEISKDFLNILSSGGTLDPLSSTLGNGNNSNDSLASLSGTQNPSNMTALTGI